MLIREAIELYLEALEEDGETIPTPQAYELTEVLPSGMQGGGSGHSIFVAHRPIAQSEERRTRIAEVVGSNPIRSTTTLHDGRRFGAVV